jgi:hypothetical protein
MFPIVLPEGWIDCADVETVGELVVGTVLGLLEGASLGFLEGLSNSADGEAVEELVLPTLGGCGGTALGAAEGSVILHTSIPSMRFSSQVLVHSEDCNIRPLHHSR